MSRAEQFKDLHSKGLYIMLLDRRSFGSFTIRSRPVLSVESEVAMGFRFNSSEHQRLPMVLELIHGLMVVIAMISVVVALLVLAAHYVKAGDLPQTTGRGQPVLFGFPHGCTDFSGLSATDGQ